MWLLMCLNGVMKESIIEKWLFIGWLIIDLTVFPLSLIDDICMLRNENVVQAAVLALHDYDMKYKAKI